MSDVPKYVRVYYSIRDDERFAGLYEDDKCLATWLRLLLAADAIWPAPADLPASANRKAIALLANAGLIHLLPGRLFRINGLDAERTARRERAQIGGYANAQRTRSD